MLYKKIFLISIVSFFANYLAGKSHCESYTTFVPHSITHDSAYELALNNYDFYHTRTDSIVNLYITPLYQQSFHGSKAAPYFLLHGKSCVSFAQDGSGDVNPAWLDLLSGNNQNYSSTISVNPTRKVYGAHIALFMDLDKYVSGLWLALAFAPLGSQQNIHICEANIQNSDSTLIPGISNGIQALNNPALQFGKFNTCSMSKAGVDDLQIKFGWNKFFCDGEQHVGIYVVGTIPSASKPKNEFVFQPRIGTRNGALGFGINGDCIVWEHCNGPSLHFMSDVKYRYLFKSHECRTFDSCGNGGWSHFLQVVTPDQRSNPMPGINSCFTQQANITPRSQIEWWNAFHWAHCTMHYEIGWNFWYRQSEKACLPCGNTCAVGIYDLGADAQRQNARHEQIREPISASAATISESVFPPNAVPSDATFTFVNNLNMKSGVPRAISNKIYAALAYDAYIRDVPTFIGLGGSVEIGNSTSALTYWSVWAKWGLEF